MDLFLTPVLFLCFCSSSGDQTFEVTWWGHCKTVNNWEQAGTAFYCIAAGQISLKKLSEEIQQWAS